MRKKRTRKPRRFLPNTGAPQDDQFETAVEPVPELEDWMTAGPAK